MLQNIKINLETLEKMLYFWQASSEGEKVGEDYLRDVAAAPEMQLLYDDELNAEGVRKVLSAITNREQMNAPTKREWKFWNNNMWVMEEQLLRDNMLRPIKVLNADALVKTINEKGSFPHDSVEILFVPGTAEEYWIDKNRLVVNFFKIQADLFDEDNVSLCGQPVLSFFEEKLLEMTAG